MVEEAQVITDKSHIKNTWETSKIKNSQIQLWSAQ